MIVLKSPDEVARMRVSGRIAARVRDKLAQSISPGTTTGDLDAFAAELIKGFGAESAFLGYRGFPGHVCLSVNEEVVHGIPGKRRVGLGDIGSVDVGVRYGGYIGDTATTVMVGVCDADVIRLVASAEKALYAGIEKARPGNRLSDISNAIETLARGMGFQVVRKFVGHGVGRKMHEPPEVPNFGPPGQGPKLREGMTLALEPMVNMGTGDVDVMGDGWTVVTADRKPSAHFEHTVALCEDGARILTLADGE